jgi:hypothetical protein
MARVRPSSLKKELEKQRKTKNKFLTRIERTVKNGKNLDFSKRELLASLEGRLRAGAIGKRPNLDLKCGMNVSDFGWCKGFEKLASEHLPITQTIAQGQLRSLDRGLKQQLASSKIWLTKNTDLPDNRESSDKPDNKKHRLKFFGKPRSYAGQLTP